VRTLAELEQRLGEVGAVSRKFDPASHLHKDGRAGFQAETMAAVALQMAREAGVDLLFCTMAEGAWVDSGRVSGVLVANKGGRSLIRARVVVDATADGDIAASAGAEFMQGDPEDGRLQHVNFKFALDGVDWSQYRREQPSTEKLLKTIRQAHRDGRLHPPTGVFGPGPETFPFHESEKRLSLSKWEIEKVDPTDPVAVSDCLAECQLAALEVVRFCRQSLPGFEACRIGRFPALLGTRESRRVVGGCVLTREDVLSGRKFEDGVVRACFFIDLHDSPPGTTIPFTLEFKKANRPPPDDWYEIPYRCLVPKGVVGLLTAGRCISADRSAQGSLRVQPTCMFIGQAAGAAAALAVAAGVAPHELDGREVRKRTMAAEATPDTAH